jgi:hypothetical protein
VRADAVTTTDVFINCPFDDEYWPLLRPLVFTVVFLQFKPRLALESLDSSVPRIGKILQMISESTYGIHDLSRLKARTRGEYYRLNMPFELGLDFGHKNFVKANPPKQILVLEKERHQYQRALSDLAGCDIETHNNDPAEMIRAVRDWFRSNILRRPILGATGIWNLFNDFMYDLHEICVKRGFSEDDFGKMAMTEFIDFASQWTVEYRTNHGAGPA